MSRDTMFFWSSDPFVFFQTAVLYVCLSDMFSWQIVHSAFGQLQQMRLKHMWKTNKEGKKR